MSVDGRCEPDKSCGPGEAQHDGACAADSADAGDDAEARDASTDEGGGAGSSGAGGGAGSSGMMALDPLCAGLACGEHGACEVTGGKAACVCSDGFTGPSCEGCEDGLVLDEGACVAPCEASNAPDCGAHGTCEDDGGAALCACTHPYAGSFCDACAEGFALRFNGACEPDCGECGAHAYCNETLMTPSCECVVGYALDDDASCIWLGDGTTGGIVAGDLKDAAAWSLDRVTVSAAGRATFANGNVNGRCHLGSMSQHITMPDRDFAEQLVMDVAYDTACSSEDADECPALQVELGDTAVRLAQGGTNTLVRSICLGDAAYGGEVALTVRPSLPYRYGTEAFGCGDAWPVLDGISIRPAEPDECPAPASAAGSLASKDGWTGAEGSTYSGGQITALAGHVQTIVHAPAGMGVAIHATAAAATLTIEGLDQTFAFGEVYRCLPPWTRGSFVSVGFRPLFAGAKVMSFSIVTDSTCAPGELDRGFEVVGAARSWDSLAVASYGIVNNSNAFEGQRVFKAGPAMDVLGLLRMPARDDTEPGLALTARRRVTGASMRGTYTIDFGPSATFTTTSTVWDSFDRMCLDPGWHGQLISVHLSASATMTSGSGTPVILLDDVGPAVSVGCD